MNAHFLAKGGAVWAGGYTCTIPWETAMLIDLAVISTVMSSKSVTSKEEAVELFAQALRPFDPEWRVGKCDGVAVFLSEAIRLEARTQVQGSRVEDMTNHLWDALGWHVFKERVSA